MYFIFHGEFGVLTFLMIYESSTQGNVLFTRITFNRRRLVDIGPNIRWLGHFCYKAGELSKNDHMNET